MNDIELQKIRENLRDIIQNKKIEDMKIEGATKEFNQLQEAFHYISQCICDTQGYITDVAKGNLDSEPPAKENFLSGASKELQSVLKHLTWQTKQVAKGDYRQRIDFLGDFSDSFNIMIQQLNERKNQLLENERAMAQTMELMVSIMNANNGWVIVTDVESENILYQNRELDKPMLGGRGVENDGVDSPSLLSFARTKKSQGEVSFTYFNEASLRHYAINSHEVVWNQEDAIAYYVLDVTHQEKEKKSLTDMAFVDELTGAYNRRYGLNAIQLLVEDKEEFSLAMIDLNNLKFVNDQIGHSSGDEYIKTVCNIIVEKVRERDMLIRMGGDEFLVVMHKCSEEGAHNKLTHIAQGVENEKADYNMSISYGIVHFDNQSERDLTEMLEISDQRMYKYKKNYKNENK